MSLLPEVEAALRDAVRRDQRSVRPARAGSRIGAGAVRVPSLGGVMTALAGGSAVLLAVLAIVVVGHGAHPAGRGSASERRSEASRHGSGVPHQLTAQFALLRRPLTRADALPARQLQAYSESQTGTGLGIMLTQARRVDVPHGNTVWVIPGARGACVFDVAGDQVCLPIAGVTGGNFLIYLDGAHSTVLRGLVPNGVRRVALTFGGGRSEDFAVHQNVFSISVGRRARTLRFRAPSGVVSIPLTR